MKTIDKLKVIDTLIESPEFDSDKIKIEPIGNQSFKVLHPCGCYFVQHGFAGEIAYRKKLEVNDAVIADRFFWVELCNKHKS
jgi:hypothetical protein